MKRWMRYLIVIIGLLGLFCYPVHASNPEDLAAAKKAGEVFGKLPLSFVENRGQADESIRFCLHNAALFEHMIPI